MDQERPVLEMRGIVKHFPGVRALNGVSVDVRPGEVHVLLGENGAGKSTLIKILSGVHPAEAGEIRIDGRRVRIRSPYHAQLHGISTIYQEFNLAPDLTVAANIFLGREPLRGRIPGIIDRRTLIRQTRDLLASLDMPLPPEAVVKRLGLAQQQLVEIAKALSFDARILVMDEPTAALTSHEIDRLLEIMRELRRRGVAIIYISHRLDEVKEVGDRATVLRDGEVVATVGVADTPTDDLIRMMVGRELREKFPKVSVTPGEEALRVVGLTRKGLLHDVSFDVHRGEILGIAGLVGSRRTETVRAIFGADRRDGGRILVHGRDAAIRKPADAIRCRLALVPEDRKRHGILASLSVTANITLTALARFSRKGLLDLRRERAHAREYAWLLRIPGAGLEGRVDLLSGGNQQKVVLARWLSCSADVFLFDEPTRGIDVAAKIEVYQLMNELVGRGAAIVMISSELPEILAMSDRVIVMRDGRISGEFKRGEVTQAGILTCALGGATEQAIPPRNGARA